MRLNASILCASEFALAIALTVFILLTAILLLLLVSLAASKNFRTVFFREKSRKKKSGKKPQAVSEPAPVMPHGSVDTVPIDPPKAPRKTPTRKAADDGTPEFLNAIPTVPLGGFPQVAPSPRGKAKQGGMHVAEIPDSDEGGAYIARSITITRARSPITTPTTDKPNRAKTDKADKVDKADKQEAEKPTARAPKRDTKK
ncbi:MAG: hypothetical protein K2F90_01780 [Clostridiales bacterium]|nr:hypothetical protein [Clostridiales bacterium]